MESGVKTESTLNSPCFLGSCSFCRSHVLSGHDDAAYQHVEPLLSASFTHNMTEVYPIFVVTRVVRCACTGVKLDKLYLGIAFTVFCTYVFSHAVVFVMACEIMSLESLEGCGIPTVYSKICFGFVLCVE